MLFWKRVELYCGYSLKEFSELRDALSAHGIRYDVKIINYADNHRRFKSPEEAPKDLTMYYLYIHNKDYDKAMFYTSNRQIHSSY